jgi:hypothetical protein
LISAWHLHLTLRIDEAISKVARSPPSHVLRRQPYLREKERSRSAFWPLAAVPALSTSCPAATSREFRMQHDYRRHVNEKYPPCLTQVFTTAVTLSRTDRPVIVSDTKIFLYSVLPLPPSPFAMSATPVSYDQHPPHGHPANTEPSTQSADKDSTASHPPSTKPDPTVTAPHPQLHAPDGKSGGAYEDAAQRREPAPSTASPSELVRL